MDGGRAEPSGILDRLSREAPPRTAEVCGSGSGGSGRGVILRAVKNRAGVARATGPAVVTAAEMVAGHVRLDISCLDRLYLNGYVNKLQTPGGVVYFFHDHRGKPIVSPALFEPIGEKFRRDIRYWAQANGIPVIAFKWVSPRSVDTSP
jgi:hypothetical protein